MSQSPLGGLILDYVEQRSRLQEFTPLTAQRVRNLLFRFREVVGSDMPPDRITYRHVERWLEAQHWAPSTARTNYSALHAFCTWLRREGYLRRDPFLELRPPRVPRYLPRTLHPEQVADVLHESPDERTELIVRLMVGEGLRAIEVSRLTLGDLDMRDKVMILRGKFGHERAVPISNETWSYLTAYLATVPRASSGPLIRSLRDPNRGIGSQAISKIVGRTMHEAGVKESGHSLRHTMAHDLVDRGAHLRDVQTILGHATLATTTRYVGVTAMGDLRKAVNGRDYRSRTQPERSET